MKWNDLKKRNIEGKELVIAVVQNADNKDIAMLAFQDKEAFDRTRETGFMYFYSTSKNKLWKKGEESGNTMKVKEVRVDCDADALLYICDVKGGACHEGYSSCFYRSLDGKIKSEKVFDPKEAYS
jgi:phosphoribosyl-AMP cyclohydrolase